MSRSERSLPRSFSYRGRFRRRFRGRFRSRLSLSAILLLAGVLFLCPSLLSCEKSEPSAFEGGSFLLTPENMQGFTVVRGDSASDLVVKESLRICQAVADATGKKVDLVTDWQRNDAYREDGANRGSDAPAESGGLELLVGLTSRAESVALLPELADGDRFLLRTVGRKILIAATSEALLPDAVDKFLSDYVSIEGNRVRIAQKIDYQSKNYSFFSIARGGASRCGFVLSKDADEPLFTAVRAVTKQMEKDYGCTFQIYREETLDSLHGMILVGNHDSSLCQNLLSPLKDTEGLVKHAGDQLFIIGKTDASVIAALSEFYALLRAAPDTDYMGYPYVRLPGDVSVQCQWEQTEIPYLLGGHKESESSIATNEVQVIFEGVSAELLERYVETLQKGGYVVNWRSVRDNRSFFAENGQFRLQVNHSEAVATASVYISRKSPA